ncbi:MAG: penicillin-binding protein, partial [Nocardioidaceae bacterium]
LRYAVTMEKKYSKDEILERYLNIVYFGDGAYGIQAAAQHFFSKPASKLTLPEAAVLAGLVRSPYAYDPTEHPETAKTRRDTVLDRMAATHAITQAAATKAKKQPLGLDVTNFPNSCNQAGGKLGFFCQYVYEEIKQNPAFGDTRQERLNLLLNGGLTIKTTLSPKKQKAAYKAVHHSVRKWSRIVGSMAMVQPGTGKIRAMALSRDFTTKRDAGKKELNVNTAVDAAHGGGNGVQFGSNAKAFTLAAALDAGYPLSTTINAPGSISGLTGFKSCDGTYSSYPHVANAAGESEHGAFNLVSGTVKSVNTFFVLLEHKVGLCKTWKMTKKLGMVQSANGKPLGQYPSLTLGADNVDPLHVATAYAAFAARGKYCKPTPFEAVYDVHGNKIKGIHPHCKQALSKGAADSVAYAMKGVLTHGTAAGTSIGRPAAGKTGTSNNGATGYFTGYTPRLSTSIALASPVSVSKYPLRGSELSPGHYAAGFGADGAPIWEEAMNGALNGKSARDFHSPPSRLTQSASLEVGVPDVVGLNVDDATSQLTGAGFHPVKGEAVDSDEPAGTVVSTSPGGGAQVDAGSTVTLTVSGGSSGGGGGGHGDGGHGNGGGGDHHGNGGGHGHGHKPKHTGPPPHHN